MILRQYVKMFAQNCVLPLYYRIWRHCRIQKNLVIFADAHHTARPVSMELLYQYLRDNKDGGTPYEIEEMYLDYQNASFSQVLRHMFHFMKRYARAGYVVICDNFLPVASCRKRKETTVIQLWHACGSYKKFGYDTPDDIPANYKGNVFQNINLVTVSAAACEAPFASAMRLPRECVRALGVSRTDEYFSDAWRASCREKFYQTYPEAAGKKIALWAPTFRGNPGDPQKIDLNVEMLQQKLGDEWLVLTRVHPHMMKKYGEKNCSITTEYLFPVTDMLIADYSSLIYEYLLFGKPVVMYVPDLEQYRRTRGFYMDIAEIPGPMVLDEAELPEAICREYGEFEQEEIKGEISGTRKRFLERYMGGCDGHATERIAAYMRSRQ